MCIIFFSIITHVIAAGKIGIHSWKCLIGLVSRFTHPAMVKLCRFFCPQFWFGFAEFSFGSICLVYQGNLLLRFSQKCEL